MEETASSVGRKGGSDEISRTSKGQKRRKMDRSESLALEKCLAEKIIHYDSLFAKLEDCFRDLRSYHLKMVSVLDDCQESLKAERVQNKHMLRKLKNACQPPTLKTNVVSPMVAGIPFKRACMTLKRLPLTPQLLAQARAASASYAASLEHTASVSSDQSSPNGLDT